MSTENKRLPPYESRKVDLNDYQQASLNREANNLIGPNNVILQVNYACYLECRMCDRHNWIANGADEKWALSTLELLKLFADLSNMNTRKINLVGTEPVMRKDLMEILAGIRSANIKPELYTAGIVLSNEVIDTILTNGVDTAFSIDGLNANSHNNIRMPNHNFNAFEKTLSSIQRLKERRKQLGLDQKNTQITANFTIQKGNIGDLAHVSNSDIDNLGVDVIRFSLVHGSGDFILDRTNIPTLINFYRQVDLLACKTGIDASTLRYLAEGSITPTDFNTNLLIPSKVASGDQKTKCHIGEYSTMIDPRGDVRPCLYLSDDNGSFENQDRKVFVVGNIRESSFQDIWNGPRYNQFRLAYEYPNLSPDSRCRTCEYFESFENLDDKLNNPNANEKVDVGW